MYSYPLYERLKSETPEFEEIMAFQAGRNRLSVRRQVWNRLPAHCARSTSPVPISQL